MTEHLKPCPFCGGNDIAVDVYDSWSRKFAVEHYCPPLNETLIIKDAIRERAIDKWNSRALSLDEKEQLRRLKAFVNEMFDEMGHAHHPLYKFRLLELGIFVADENNIATKADWLKRV
jgi:hypothetical protein